MNGGLNNLDGINGPAQPAPVPGGLSKDSVLLSWQSVKKVQEKDKKYFLMVGAVVLFPIVYSVFTKDWFILILIAVLLPVIYFYAKNRGEEKGSYKITPLGVYENDRFYAFSEIHSFWIVFNEKVRTLNIVFMKKYLPQLTIDISNSDPLKIKAVLAKKIPEQEKRGESLIDYFVRLFDL